MRTTKVITYASPGGDTINLTPRQVAALTAARVWPRTWLGEEYCMVSRGLHFGARSVDSDLPSDIVERAI